MQKILDGHIVEGEPVAGSEVAVKVDQTLTQDATGTMVYLELEAMGVDCVRTECSVSYVDHNTLQVGPENADDHAFLRSVAARYGVIFSRPGNGICHQVHLERFAAPGKVLLGSDSHTPTCGGMGMFAVGAGGIDVAAAMAGEPFRLAYPSVVEVRLEGRLPAGVDAKDVILHVLGILSTTGNVGRVLEYTGEGTASLSVEQRATIANMGAETGVTTSVFPSDEKTRIYLRAQGREEAWCTLSADEDAAYDDTIMIDLGSLVPMIALPHSPGNVRRVEEVAGTKVDQVIIGSCTNASVMDLALAAAVLEGGRVAPWVDFIVVPGSRQALLTAQRLGIIETLIRAGARVYEPVCGFCIGNGAAPRSGGVSLRTNNRNFKGRCGTQDAGVYLVGPRTAAASALAGYITDPREMADKAVQAEPPQEFVIDDSMFIFPPEEPAERRSTVVVKPPGMKPLPVGEPLPEELRCVVAAKLGDEVTTDDIMPAGPRLKYRSNIEKYSSFVFENMVPDFVQRCRQAKDAGLGVVIAAGKGYGQGSSREHAALCPAYLGVRAVVAGSFERIHAANLVNFGIVPLVFRSGEDYGAVEEGGEVVFLNLRSAIENGLPVVMELASGGRIELGYSLSEYQKKLLLAGGRLAYIRKGKGA